MSRSKAGGRRFSRAPGSRSRVPPKGFTLIELLVALVIFATMAAIAYRGLDAVSRSRIALDDRERDLAALGRSLSMIERDLRSIAARPIRGEDGAPLPPLMAQAGDLELSSYGRGRAAGNDLGLIERNGYGLDGDGLFRLHWYVLDRAQRTRPDRRALLPDATALRWRMLAVDGRWHERWPAPGSADPDALPRAVELLLVHARLGEVRRVVELPGAPAP